MGMGDVVECLEKQDKPISRREIAQILDCNPCNVSHLIQRLLKQGAIKCVEYDRMQTAKALGLKKVIRRTRFYYV